MVVTFKLLGRLDTIALAETAGNAPCKMVCLTNVESSPLLGTSACTSQRPVQSKLSAKVGLNPPAISRFVTVSLLLVLVAGLCWSSMGLGLRLMDGAHAWQVLFYRSIAMSAFLLVVLSLTSRGRPLLTVRKAGMAAVIGGFCLIFAFAGGIYAIQTTTVANAMFLFAAAPFFAALLGWMVLGEEVHTTDPAQMQEAILTRLFNQYAAQHGIEATNAEISNLIGELQRGMQEDGLTVEADLTPDEATQVETMRRDMARSMIRQWKINRRLYGEYGGRVIYQQLGPEPLDAYRRFLEEQQRAGAFTILDKSLEAAFWQYFTDDTRHTFFKKGSEAGAFEQPPWEHQ